MKPVQSKYSPNISSASRFQEKSFLSANPYLLILGPAGGYGMQLQNLWYDIIVKKSFFILKRKHWIISITNSQNERFTKVLSCKLSITAEELLRTGKIC